MCRYRWALWRHAREGQRYNVASDGIGPSSIGTQNRQTWNTKWSFLRQTNPHREVTGPQDDRGTSWYVWWKSSNESQSVRLRNLCWYRKGFSLTRKSARIWCISVKLCKTPTSREERSLNFTAAETNCCPTIDCIELIYARLFHPFLAPRNLNNL